MKPKNSPWIFLITVLLILSACKKYPDGPQLSLYTKEHRIAAYWDVEYFEVDGADSTAYLKSQPFYGYYDFGKEVRDRTPVLFHGNDQQYTLGGHWSFQNSKKEIHINFGGYNSMPGSIGPYRAESIRWTIRRLKEKEMWLETTYNGKRYFVKFSQ